MSQEDRKSTTIYTLFNVTPPAAGCLAWIATVATCTTAILALLRFFGS